MDKPMSNFHFKLMSLGFLFRDTLLPRRDILKEVEIGPGVVVLDYGCGTGSYSIPATELVGETGMVYALDIHPLAIGRVQKRSQKRGVANIETILSDCATGLPEGCVDIALLFDTLHELGNPQKILEELRRVLKPGGICSVSDHHMKEEEILSEMAKSGSFKLWKKGKKIYHFMKGEYPRGTLHKIEEPGHGGYGG